MVCKLIFGVVEHDILLNIADGILVRSGSVVRFCIYKIVKYGGLGND